MEMTIADGLKYKESLIQRLAKVDKTIDRTELIQTTTRVVSNNEESRVEEITTPKISVKDFLSERDSLAKEIRLISQQIERYNHSVILDGFNPTF